METNTPPHTPATYPLKVQVIRSQGQQPRLYVSFPLALAAAIGLELGEANASKLTAAARAVQWNPHAVEGTPVRRLRFTEPHLLNLTDTTAVGDNHGGRCGRSTQTRHPALTFLSPTAKASIGLGSLLLTSALRARKFTAKPGSFLFPLFKGPRCQKVFHGGRSPSLFIEVGESLLGVDGPTSPIFFGPQLPGLNPIPDGRLAARPGRHVGNHGTNRQPACHGVGRAASIQFRPNRAGDLLPNLRRKRGGTVANCRRVGRSLVAFQRRWVGRGDVTRARPGHQQISFRQRLSRRCRN